MTAIRDPKSEAIDTIREALGYHRDSIDSLGRICDTQNKGIELLTELIDRQRRRIDTLQNALLALVAVLAIGGAIIAIVAGAIA